MNKLVIATTEEYKAFIANLPHEWSLNLMVLRLAWTQWIDPATNDVIAQALYIQGKDMPTYWISTTPRYRKERN